MAGLHPLNQHRVSTKGDIFPSIGRLLRNISAGLALSFPLAVTWAQPAQAVLIFNFYELGSDLVIDGTGSLNLPSSPTGSGSCPPGGLLSLPYLFCTGQATSGGGSHYSITGPSTLGTGILPMVFASSNSGIPLAIQFTGVFLIDSTYVSGTPIFSSSTFSGISLASLGMTTPGTLGTWTLDGSGETISLQVNASSSGSPANVPGPLSLLGLGAAFGVSRRLRRRVQLRSKTSQLS